MARSLRGGLTECWHFGALAVVDAAGARVARLGDSELPVFMRSTAKPLQALAMLELGLEGLELEPADLALICASHGGCELHTARVLELLARRRLGTAALLCGTQPPLDETARQALERGGGAASALHNNCSGKHAGMLLTCVEAGLSLGDYIDGAHPLQRRIAATVARIAGLEPEDIGVGIDGCSLPTYYVPLAAVARTYVALAAPEGLADAGDRRRLAAIYAAMTSAPEMVAGPGRFTTRLMEVGAGLILAKEGADGLYAVGVRGARPLGLALKIADGTEICRDGVVLEILERLELLDAAQLRELEPFRRPLRSNRRGRTVGEVVPDLALERDAAP